MLDDLTPRGLHQAARELGVDPFGVVALLVAADAVPVGSIRLDHQSIEQLRISGGIEPSWWEQVTLPDDADPRRARVRAALHLLLDRGFVGEVSTRHDNLWRGLESGEAAMLRDAVAGLAEEGVLSLTASYNGQKVAVTADQRETAEAIAGGRLASSAVDSILDASAR